MNRTIISIEVQDYGGKDAAIIIRGERNNQIMFEEQFDYKDNENILYVFTYWKNDLLRSSLNMVKV